MNPTYCPFCGQAVNYTLLAKNKVEGWEGWDAIHCGRDFAVQER